MDLFRPDKYYKSIYDVNYIDLKNNGIKCILFDLDNTLVPPNENKPNKKIHDLIDNLKELDFKIIIMSNSPKKRLAPFKDELVIDCSAFSLKPLKKKFNKILKEYKFDLSQIVIIGDQLLTDVFGGNRIGIMTILVNPISKKDFKITSINRRFEHFIETKLEKRNLFKRGKYYE